MKYEPRTRAMAHQTEALRRRTLRPPGYDDVFCDTQEMGCGKTKTLLDEWQSMVSEEYVSDLLVIAPKGCVRSWYADKSEKQHSELRTHLDPRLLRRLALAGWSGKPGDRRACAALLSVTDRPRALFVNVEALSSSDKALELCKKFMRGSRRGCTLVLDESVTVRNYGSRRTQVIVRWLVKRRGVTTDESLRPLAKVRRIASGLITPKSPMDLYWQFYFLDKRILGYEDFTTFRERYAKTRRACYEPNEKVRYTLVQTCGLKQSNLSPGLLRSRLQRMYAAIGSKRVLSPGMSPREVRVEMQIAVEGMKREQMVECILALGGWITSHVEVEEFRNLDELHAKIAPFTYRVLKSECMDPPPKVYQFRDVDLTADQERMYEEMRRKATAELEGKHVTAASVLAQMMRLHQIVLGHTRSESGELMIIKSNRVDAVLEVLSEHSGKAIVWSAYRPEIEALAARLTKELGPDSFAQFHGGNAGTRHLDERRFLEDPRCGTMLASQGAAGRGNTWIEPSLAIYLSNNYDLDHRMQSEDRCHRKGQRSCVTYVDCIARGTVEEKIVQALRDKIDLAIAVTGENYREWLI